MKLDTVMEELGANLARVRGIAGTGLSEGEVRLFLSAALLRSAAQCFGAGEKADFARTAKIAWVHAHEGGRS